jgi:AAA domain
MSGPRFRPVLLADLLAQVPDRTPWVWERYMAEGSLAVLAAFMKVGKSTLAYALAVAVAQGRPFLGLKTLRGPVLLLAVEEHGRDVRRRLEGFGARPTDLIHVHVGSLPNDAVTFRSLREFVRREAIVLVLLDTLSFFAALRDEDDNAEMIRAVKPLLALARDTEAAVLLVHHESKRGGEGGRSIRGASALLGLVDQALILEGRQGGRPTERVLKAVGRYDETPAELVIDLEGNAWRRLGSPEEVSTEASEARVLSALAGGAWHETGAIATHVSVSDRMVRKLLDGPGDRVDRRGEGRKGSPYAYRLRGSRPGGSPDPGPLRGAVGPESNPATLKHGIPD